MCVVGVTTRVRGIPTEVALGKGQGLRKDCVANCDHVFTVAKGAFGGYRGELGPVETRQLNDALRIALQLD